jgi:hypothetical protein
VRNTRTVEELSHSAENLLDEPVRSAQRRVELRPDANQPAGNRELRLGVQRDDAGKDRLAPARPVLCFVTLPGRISTSIPRRSTPERIHPPTTPHLSSPTSATGLFTSNDRITITRGSEEEMGSGMRFTMHSFKTSMFSLSCAEIGTMGYDSASVPAK